MSKILRSMSTRIDLSLDLRLQKYSILKSKILRVDGFTKIFSKYYRIRAVESLFLREKWFPENELSFWWRGVEQNWELFANWPFCMAWGWVEANFVLLKSTSAPKLSPIQNLRVELFVFTAILLTSGWLIHQNNQKLTFGRWTWAKETKILFFSSLRSS